MWSVAPTRFTITLMDKREFTAKVIGKDPKTDLALIKIDTQELLPYGRASAIRRRPRWVTG